MTKKQFFKKAGLDQSRDKKPFIYLVKKYKGFLSYYRLFMLTSLAIILGRRGVDILYFIDSTVNDEIKRKEVQT